MRRLTLELLLVGLALVVGLAPAHAQSSVTLTSSNQDVIFATGSTSGSLAVQLGSCVLGLSGNVCTLSGSASGSVGASAAASYQIVTAGLIPLSGNGSGTFTASASSLTGSTVLINSSSVQIFQGTLTSLSFFESATVNGQVTMNATATGTGTSAGVTVALSGTIFLPAGSNINAVATSATPTNVSGRFGTTTATVVPEPTSVFLLGSGLIGIGGALRRRRQQA